MGARVGHGMRLKPAAILPANIEGYVPDNRQKRGGYLKGLKALWPPGIKESPPHILRYRTRCSAITLLLCFGSFFSFLSLSSPYCFAQGAAAPHVERRETLLAINDVYRIGGVERGRRGGLPRVRTLRRELEIKDHDLNLHSPDDVTNLSALDVILI